MVNLTTTEEGKSLTVSQETDQTTDDQVDLEVEIEAAIEIGKKVVVEVEEEVVVAEIRIGDFQMKRWRMVRKAKPIDTIIKGIIL